MKKFCATVLLSIAAASPIYALDLVQWGKAGDCVILQHPNKNNACLTQVSLSDGTLMRLGLQDKGRKGFPVPFNPAWKNLKNNNKYPVGQALDGTVSESAAEGKEGNGVPGAQITRENADFRAGLAGKKTMTFSFWGAEILKIDPRGSEDAIKAMLACQAEQG